MEAMSWSEDKRCVYCGTRLPLHRKVVDEQFCSDSHKRSFRIEQDQLALQRLHDNHQALEVGAIRQLKNDLAMRQIGGDGHSSSSAGAATALAEAPMDAPFEARPANYLEAQLFSLHRESISAPDGLALLSGRSSPAAPLSPDEPEPVNEFFAVLAPAGPGICEVFLEANGLAYLENDELSISLCTLAIVVAGLEPRMERSAIQYPLPPSAKARPRAAQSVTWVEPEASSWSVTAPVLTCEIVANFGGADQTDEHKTSSLAGPCLIGLRRQPLIRPAFLERILVQNVAALWQAELALALPARLQAGVLSGPAFAPSVLPPLPTAAGSVERHPISAQPAFRLAPVIPARALKPQSSSPFSRLLPLWFPLRPMGMRFVPVQPDSQPRFSPSMRHPGMKLKTAAPETEKNRLQGALAFWTGSRGSSAHANPLRLATDFWQNAPRDLKLLAIGIPVLLALVFHPSLPKIHSSTRTAKVAPPQTRPTAPVSFAAAKSFPEPKTIPMAVPGSVEPLTAVPLTSVKDDWKSNLLSRFGGLRQTVAERAGVELNEDFRSGLEEWQAENDPSSAFEFDQNGFVRPSTMALYRPSLGLKDYDMQFLGLLDKTALSWVVRASDFHNYYAVKLVVAKGGPTPILRLVRYPVIAGRAGRRVETPVRMNAQADTLYRIGMNIHDDTFLLTIQGNVVDSWTDATLRRGGVGFFSAAGEASRLRWVQVAHQYDILGRLCAYLAPYNSQSFH